MIHSRKFAEEALKLMRMKGISGNEMARKIKVAPSTMSGYLNGQRAWPLDKAVECSDYLARSVPQLLGREDN